MTGLGRRLAAVLVASCLVTAGCSGDGSTYTIEALFPQAVALFEGSAVQAMGVPVGEVTAVRVEGTAVRVVMEIDRRVRIPADVTATITPVSLIGERNIVLTPAWRPGMEVAQDGHQVPPERIGRVVEPDDVLIAVTQLVEAIDPDRMASFLADTAETLDGHGPLINAAIEDGASLLRFLDSRDDDLLAMAGELRSLAAALNARHGQIDRLIQGYTRATGILADERANFSRLLRALQTLTDEGGRIVAVLEDDLTEGLADLLQVQLRIEANVDSVNRMLESLPEIGELVHDAYRENPDSLALVLGVPETLQNVLEQIFGALGIPLCLEGVAC